MKQRVDLFTPVHKAIRAILFELGKELQSTNMSDNGERDAMLTKLTHLLELLEEHARHEDEIIFPPIEKACPGLTTESVEEHLAYDAKVNQIHKLVNAIRTADDMNERLHFTRQLRHQFADFIAFYLMHMNHEEEAMLEASIEHLTPQELIDIRLKVQLDTPPARYDEWLHWMLPALDLTELVPLFKQVKVGAPESVYTKFKQIGKHSIDQHRWSKLVKLAEVG